MRTLLCLILALTSVVALGCAQERDYYSPDRSPVIPPYDDDEDASVPVDAGGTHVPNSDAAGGSFPDARVPDAGPRDSGVSVDARVDASADARVDAGYDANWDRDADADADAVEPDAGSTLPAWLPIQPIEQGPVSVATDCPTPPPTPPVNDSCRAWPWHTPPCYRVPVECKALYESSYCLSIQNQGAPVFTGVDSGLRCATGFFPEYNLTAEDHTLAQLGGDIFTTDQGVLVKHSLADGSFDVAPRAVHSVFVLGQQLVLLAPDGQLLAYPSWRDVVSDQNSQMLASVSPPTGAVFGANATTIVAAWPSGRLDLVTPKVSARILRVQGYQPEVEGNILAVDLSEDGSRIFVLSRDGIWTVDAMTGKTLQRRYAPNLQGLSCSAGISGSMPQPTPGEPRPGFYYDPPRAENAILASADCVKVGPYNGPRYYGQSSGPELLVIATFFNDGNVVVDERTAPHVLALTAVGAASWTVRVAQGALLERILVSGGHGSSVTVESSSPIPVEYHLDDPDSGSNSLGSAAGSWPALDQAELQRNLEEYTKRPLTEFMGCYFGTMYEVRNVPPLCAP